MAIPISDRAEDWSVRGSGGRIEVVVDFPGEAARNGPSPIALIAHPHPLFGGSLDNKVVQTLAKTLLELGFVSLRPNFRGVGASEGVHDDGNGETEDLVAVLACARERFGDAPPVLCGYSFGGYVQACVAQRVKPRRMVLVGLASGRVSGARE